MEAGQSHVRFKTTSWTMIARARDGGDELEQLLRTYWSPVYAYLRRSGKSPDDAADLTQSFLSEVLVGRDLIGRADAARGRFKSYLLASLKRFVVDRHREERGRNGERPVMIPVDDELMRAVEPSKADDPMQAFDRQWAAATLQQALHDLERECAASGMGRQWRAFDARVLGPALRGSEPVAIEVLMEELGAASQQEIYSMLQTMKRKYQRVLREIVAQTVESPDEVDSEIDELRGKLVM